ncbi:MAG TPA: GNAT family protein [Candidatus Hydrogenedentes bacterium]|nr:GNAT family protein [Candidatus Hydrogenedentota bacterium]HPU96738.1 GNAT family protein [Candidatus Hydrogenedentota bacterium]
MPYSTDLYLRRAERDDLEQVIAWMSEPDFTHFLYGDPAQSPRQVREKIISMLGRQAGAIMPPAIYLIIDSPSLGTIGMISLQQISWRNRSCAIDVYVDRKHRDHWITAAAVFRALEYCFDELNLHRVSAFIYAFNRASWRVFELAGARRELVFEAHVPREGKLEDAYGYGLLREDFDRVRQERSRFAEGMSLRGMIEKLLAEPDPGDPAQ